MVHHEEDAGLLALDEAACEAVGNASARGPSAGIQVSPNLLDAGTCPQDQLIASTLQSILQYLHGNKGKPGHFQIKLP